MDYLKNTLEELVISEVERSFSAHREVCQCLQCKKDVTVYILNNIKPRYIISTRGMLHEATNQEERRRVEEEIAALLPEGIKRVNANRRPGFEHEQPGNGATLLESMGKKERFTMTEGFHFNFPFFIGEVRDQAGTPLSGVTVTLSVSGTPLDGWDGNWPNPYETSDKSAGKFAFWPRSTRADNDQDTTFADFDITIRCVKPGYAVKEIAFTLMMESQRYIINFIRKDYTKDMGFVELLKE